MESQGDAGRLGDVPKPRRWGRVADVIEGGVIYMEDAERLVLAGITLPSDPDQVYAGARVPLRACGGYNSVL